MAIATGARVILPRTFDGDEILPLLREHRPTLLWMLPAALVALVRDHDARRDDFASVRLCISGGDKVPAELEKEFTALTGFPIDEGWGMSEVGFSTVSPPSGPIKLGSVGRLNPGYELSIRDEDGRDLPVGAPGRLWIRSPSNMVGYWNRPDATAETIRDGWLHTGDVATVDAEGFVYINDRKKDMIISGGENIYPAEIENVILSHPKVREVAVIGQASAKWGEAPLAIVVKQDPSLSEDEVVEWSRGKLAGYKRPRAVRFVDEIPRNPAGKILKRVLRERFPEPAAE
jgi:acyl-CoA synthetase (AMP-forming)/AMP-acid ligase II